MKTLLAFLLLAFDLCLLQAQPYLSFQHITSADGLSGAYNHFVRQDKYGDLWISSTEGVFRYDGWEMLHYTEENQDVPGMLGKNVQSDFFEDKDGNIWFTTFIGINKYDRANDCFEAIQLADSEDNLIEEGYRLFWLEHDSILWLRAANDLYTYNVRSQKATRLLELDYYAFAVQTDTAGNVIKIFAAKVMGTDPLVILHTHNRQITRRQFFQVNVTGQPLAFQSMHIQSDTLVWLCTDVGLIALNPNDLTQWKYYSLPRDGGQRLRQVIKADEQQLMVATGGQGIWLFDLAQRIFTKNITHDDFTPNSISDNDVRNVYLSPERQLWLSYNQGKTLDHVWLQPNSFRNPLAKQSIPSPDIESIAKDGEGRVWCATRNAGIFVLDTEGKPVRHFLPGQLAGESNRIIQLSTDSNGSIWVAAMRRILVFNTKFECSSVALPDNIQVYFLLHLSWQRKLISTNQGIRELVWDGNSYKIVESVLFPTSERMDYFQMFQTSNNRFYVTANGNTLLYFPFNGNKKSYKIRGEISGVWENSDDTAWIGTSNGLFQLNLVTDSITQVNLTIAGEKPSQIYGVQGDRLGRLWLSTDKGIWRYDPDNGRCHAFRHYLGGNNFADGMLYASLKNKDGYIWFGTNEGLIVFHPDSIQLFPGAPRVKIKSLLVNNEPYRPLPNLDDLQILQLPYRLNNLTFNVVAVNQYYPKSNKIGYRIKNKDENENENWQWVTNGSAVMLPGLRPGMYELEMKAMNLHGLEGESRAVYIHILTPLWLRWWFILLSLGAVIGIGYLIARAYVQRKLRQQQLVMEQQQALQNERNRIAAELHDDLGWGLTRIQYISEDLMQVKKAIGGKQKIQHIYDYTRVLLHDMSDIIWILDTETETLANWLAQLQSDIYEFLEAAHLNHQLAFPENVPAIMLNRSWRRNCLLAIKETLRNITKHADASCVEIKINIHTHHLHVQIQDDGKGFDLNELDKDKSGRGIQNIIKRIKALKGVVTWEKSDGTLVGMDIPLPK